MSKRIFSGMLLSLLLIGMLTLAFSIRTVKSDWIWTGTIYIRADGSVDPSDAPISTADRVTYTLTDNITGDVPGGSSAIIVERDNIVVDGAGFTLQETQAFRSHQIGMNLFGRQNVTIVNMEIRAFWCGILLQGSSNNHISRNNLAGNGRGMEIWYSSSYNIISENNITNSWCGISLYKSSSNNISENMFVNDGLLVQDSYENLVRDNLVNGKPLVYLECVSDYVVEDAGQVILINCNRIKVEGAQHLLHNSRCGAPEYKRH